MAERSRQRVLQLWLVAAALDTEVVAWAHHGPSDDEAPDEPVARRVVEPPYGTGIEALDDGWRLLQAPGPAGPATTGELGWEFVFERWGPAG